MVPWSPQIANTNRSSNSPNQKAVPRKLGAQPPIVTSTTMGLNGPDTPPVVFNPYADIKISTSHEDEEEERCRNCYSTALVTDWAQGDRVCTSCGVVAEEKMRDDRPEWKDFNDAEDIIKGLPAKARSGLVAVDETKYVGGLQPTILSKDAFGQNSGGFKMTKIRRQLKTTNKRLDHIMEKIHKRALQDARLERRVKLKREQRAGRDIGSHSSGGLGCTENSEIRPEFDQLVLQEEEDSNRLQAAINADKWSLDRAIFLFGNSTDTFSRERAMHDLEMGENSDDLLSRMDKNLKESSQDLYMAYSMTTEAARKLNLPSRVMDESIHRLLRYVVRRDGFSVRGVSSRLPKALGKENKEERKVAAMRLREYNKMRQISSLGAAILFLTSRSLGWTRTVAEICDCFHPSLEHSSETISIKPKHCSKAMNEIKTYFPEYSRIQPSASVDQSHAATANDTVSASNFADHFIRNLQLPPVAEASVRTLFLHCRQEQVELGLNSGIKLPTLCAAVVYFVSSAGSAMQKVAHQIRSKKDNAKASNPDKCNSSLVKLSPVFPTDASARTISDSKDSVDEMKWGPGLSQRIDDSERNPMIKKSSSENDSDSDDDSNIAESNVETFDVFTHAPIVEDQAEKLEYNMRRMWDAWAEQMRWSRSVIEIEQACNVSGNTMVNLYKSDLYPRREMLLKVWESALSREETEKSLSAMAYSTLSETPMASTLLAHIATAGGLMSRK